MKALILTKKNKYGVYEAKRVGKEANKIGCDVDILYYEDFCINFLDDKVRFTNKGEDIDFSQYRWCYSRSSNIGSGVTLSDLKTLILKELVGVNTKILNGKSLLQNVHLSKLLQYYVLSQNSLPVIQTQYQGMSTCQTATWNYPIIVKNLLGSMGKNVKLVKNFEEESRVTSNQGLSRVLRQKFLNDNTDYRVLVLGGEVIGAIKRIPSKGSYLANISAGGSAEQVKTTELLDKLSIEAALCFDLDFCGVDILCDQYGKHFILEINRHPQFQGFESTGVNVAAQIVRYLS